MKYHCGHKGCDICSKRDCDYQAFELLDRIGDFEVCFSCLRRAVKFAYEASATFGGTFIDPARPCGSRAL